ncbi:MAG: DUF3822 family protein [Niabella sp.]
MQPIFYIKDTEKAVVDGDVLAVQLGSGYFGYAVTDSTGNQLVELGWYNLKDTGTQSLDVILQSCEAFRYAYDRIVTAFNFDTYFLIPEAYNTGDSSSLMYLNGASQQDHIMYDNIHGSELSLVYTVPYSLLNWCIQNLPGTEYWHLQTIRLQRAGKDAADGIIRLQVGAGFFNVAVAKGGQWLLSHSYPYYAPADVLFYVLKICETFGLGQETVQLELCGLIEEDSALYNMLYQYILNISFQKPEWQVSAESELPSHYFTTLNQLSLCASSQEV